MRKIFFIFMVLAFGIFMDRPARAQDVSVETVYEFPADMPPGNVAISPMGRVFMSVHGFYGQDVKVVEVLKNGKTKPYPNEAWAFAPQSGAHEGLNGVLGLNVDARGILWMLDDHAPGHSGKLVGWNTQTERLEKVIYLAQPVIRADSFLNDLAIDHTRNIAVIVDTASGDHSALIIVDLNTGVARRVLEGSSYTVAEDLDMVIDGQLRKLGGNPVRIGVNPITVSPDFQWIYFAPMTGRSIYRVRMSDLLDESLGGEALAARVERYGDKVISDGITIDDAGHVYITDITHDAIGVTLPNGQYQQLFQRDDISWPDGFAVGADGYIYFTVNELHRSPVLNGGENAAQGEFKIMRFKPLAPAQVGR